MVELHASDEDAVSVVTVVCVVHSKLQEAFVCVEVYKLNLPFVAPICGGEVGTVQGDVCQVDRQQVCPYELLDVVVCADIPQLSQHCWSFSMRTSMFCLFVVIL